MRKSWSPLLAVCLVTALLLQVVLAKEATTPTTLQPSAPIIADENYKAATKHITQAVSAVLHSGSSSDEEDLDCSQGACGNVGVEMEVDTSVKDMDRMARLKIQYSVDGKEVEFFIVSVEGRTKPIMRIMGEDDSKLEFVTDQLTSKDEVTDALAIMGKLVSEWKGTTQSTTQQSHQVRKTLLKIPLPKWLAGTKTRTTVTDTSTPNVVKTGDVDHPLKDVQVTVAEGRNLVEDSPKGCRALFEGPPGVQMRMILNIQSNIDVPLCTFQRKNWRKLEELSSRRDYSPDLDLKYGTLKDPEQRLADSICGEAELQGSEDEKGLCGLVAMMTIDSMIRFPARLGKDREVAMQDRKWNKDLRLFLPKIGGDLVDSDPFVKATAAKFPAMGTALRALTHEKDPSITLKPIKTHLAGTSKKMLSIVAELRSNSGANAGLRERMSTPNPTGAQKQRQEENMDVLYSIMKDLWKIALKQ